MKKLFFLAMLVALPDLANAVPITSLEITGGQFTVNNMPNHVSSITPGAYASMSVDGSYDGVSPNWDWSGGVVPREADYLPLSIVAFEFSFYGPFSVFTAPADDFDTATVYPGVTGDLTGSILTLDLRSWTAYWDSYAFNQGAANVTAVVDHNGYFTASWDAQINGGAFAPSTGNWTITGYVSAVPLPASLWLFVSGVVGIIGFNRKRGKAGENCNV